MAKNLNKNIGHPRGNLLFCIAAANIFNRRQYLFNTRSNAEFSSRF